MGGDALRAGWAAAAALALASCTPAPVGVSPTPPERPDRAAAASLPEPERSPESRALARYYARVQSDLLAQGLLRTDGGGRDTPFDARMLTENFVRIALFDEYAEDGGTMVARQTASELRRWAGPVRIELEFGETVPAAQARDDRAALATLAARLARVTGHPIRSVRDGGNFHVLMLHEDERRGYADRLRELVPGIGQTALRTITDMPRSTYCLVFAFSEGASREYVRAVAVIRAEHPDLLRLSCLHEEVAQGLGLANDSPAARPSIFNDDEEFALLTRHDELLLRMLYDDRLRPGMDSRAAGPIARAIAEELIGGET
jgi:hypothetical protein